MIPNLLLLLDLGLSSNQVVRVRMKWASITNQQPSQTVPVLLMKKKVSRITLPSRPLAGGVLRKSSRPPEKKKGCCTLNKAVKKNSLSLCSSRPFYVSALALLSVQNKSFSKRDETINNDTEAKAAST